MASKLVTERGFRRERFSSSATNPHHHVREGPLGFDWFRPHLVDVRESPAAEKVGRRTSWRSDEPRQQDLGHIGSRSVSST